MVTQWQPPASSGDWRNRTWDSLSTLKRFEPPKLPPLPTRAPESIFGTSGAHRSQVEYYKKRLQAGEKPADLLKELELKETQRANYAKAYQDWGTEMSKAAQQTQEQAWEQEKFGRQELRYGAKMDLDEAYRQKTLDLAYWNKQFQEAKAAKDEARTVIADQRIAEAAKDLHDIRVAKEGRAKEKYKYDVSQRGISNEPIPYEMQRQIRAEAGREAMREATNRARAQILKARPSAYAEPDYTSKVAIEADNLYPQIFQEAYQRLLQEYAQLAPRSGGVLQEQFGARPSPWGKLGETLLRALFGLGQQLGSTTDVSKQALVPTLDEPPEDESPDITGFPGFDEDEYLPPEAQDSLNELIKLLQMYGGGR